MKRSAAKMDSGQLTMDNEDQTAGTLCAIGRGLGKSSRPVGDRAAVELTCGFDVTGSKSTDRAAGGQHLFHIFSKNVESYCNPLAGRGFVCIGGSVDQGSGPRYFEIGQTEFLSVMEVGRWPISKYRRPDPRLNHCHGDKGEGRKNPR